MKLHKDKILRIKNQPPVVKRDSQTNIVIFNNEIDILTLSEYEIIEKEIEINYLNMSFKELLEKVIPKEV